MGSLVGHWVDFGSYFKIGGHWSVSDMGITRSVFHFNRISLTVALRGQRELMVEVRSLEAIRKQFSIYFGLKA